MAKRKITVLQKFTGGAVKMLTSIDGITERLIIHQPFLVLKNTLLTLDYLSDMQGRIAGTRKDVLGTDGAKALRASTQRMALHMIEAKSLCRDLYQLIEIQFKGDLMMQSELLTVLGFNANYPKASRDIQESMVKLLHEIAEDVEPYKGIIKAKGFPDASMARILELAEEVHGANVAQETEKVIRMNLTDEKITALNAIYDEVIGWAKIAATAFEKEPAIQVQFRYNRALGHLSGGTRATKPVKPIDERIDEEQK